MRKSPQTDGKKQMGKGNGRGVILKFICQCPLHNEKRAMDDHSWIDDPQRILSVFEIDEIICV